MSDVIYESSKKLAEAHVDWYLKSIRPLLIDHMVHGFKHGVQYSQENPERKGGTIRFQDIGKQLNPDGTIKRPA